MWSLMMRLRRKLYRQGWIQSVQIPCAVVSVGNLSLGGSGKTPFIDMLLRELKQRGLKGEDVLVVSRNYRAKVTTSAEVSLLHEEGGSYFGDEPYLIKSLHPEVKVWVGPSKSETAQLAFEKHRPRLILIDDGFQHLRLKRDLDLVLLDPSDIERKVFPFGRLRESVSALSVAHWVVLNPCESDAQLSDLTNQLRAKKIPPSRAAGVRGKLKIPGEDYPSIWAAFCGIARPERFIEGLMGKMGSAPKKVWRFGDHHPYSDADLDGFESWLLKHPRGVLYTTEKDAVKILKWIEERPRIRVVAWRLQGINCEGIIDDISRAVEKHGR